MTAVLCCLLLLAVPPRAVPAVHVDNAEDIVRYRAVAEGKQAPEPMSEETARQFATYRARMNGLFSKLQGPPTLETAALLDHELYEEMGVPYLNGRWQEIVVGEIEHVAQRSDAPPEVLEDLRATLMEYAGAGGGVANPVAQISLAKALVMYGGPDHPECDQLALSFSERARRWASELGSQTYQDLCAQAGSDVEKVLAWKQATTPELATAPRQVQRAIARLDTLVRGIGLGDSTTDAQIDSATQAATLPLLTGRLAEDAVSRLLKAFHFVLRNKKRPRREVILAIDAKLLWLAKDSRKLTTEEHWSLWADNIAALGRKTSRELGRYVHDTERRPPNKLVEAGVKKAANALRKD